MAQQRHRETHASFPVNYKAIKSYREKRYPIDPAGGPLNITQLPPKGFAVGGNNKGGRWCRWYKAQVVLAVRQGVIDLPTACQSYAMSFDEFLYWDRNFLLREKPKTIGASLAYTQ